LFDKASSYAYLNTVKKAKVPSLGACGVARPIFVWGFQYYSIRLRPKLFFRIGKAACAPSHSRTHTYALTEKDIMHTYVCLIYIFLWLDWGKNKTQRVRKRWKK